jgi:probable DNA metabolism protein
MCDRRALDGDLVYLYDGSFEGMLTAIFEAYYREAPGRILAEGCWQQALDERYETVETDLSKSGRVHDAIEAKIGKTALGMVYYGWLSHEPERATRIYEFLRLGFRIGPGVTARLADPAVDALFRINRPVLREYDKQRGFLRFSVMEGGIYYAKEETVSYQLPLLTPYFFDRMTGDPFIIHDVGRNLAGVSDTRQWRIVSAETFTAPGLSQDETDYRRLWIAFHETIAIQSRLNPKLQSQLAPKRYWKYMTEMNGGKQ